jgi:hypothetical protein
VQIGIFYPTRLKRRKEDTLSDLIKRFKEDLQLAGYAKRSTESYVSSVLRLQRFYNKPLEDITEEDLRQYWLCCQSEFGWSAASLRISYAGIQHFFTRTLVRSWNIFNEESSDLTLAITGKIPFDSFPLVRNHRVVRQTSERKDQWHGVFCLVAQFLSGSGQKMKSLAPR